MIILIIERKTINDLANYNDGRYRDKKIDY